MKAYYGTTASILEKAYCRLCGWPIIDACCNYSFATFKDAKDWDWWQYCSNKACEKHEGEGVFQNRPDWIGYIRKLPWHIRLQEWWFYHIRFPFLMWLKGVTLKQIQKRNDRREKLYRVLKLIENETPKSIRKPDRKKN